MLQSMLLLFLEVSMPGIGCTYAVACYLQLQLAGLACLSEVVVHILGEVVLQEG